MNEKQKQAITILNSLRMDGNEKKLTEEEYFLLLEFVIATKEVVYYPYYTPSTPQTLPYAPFYETKPDTFRVTSGMVNTVTT